MNNGKEVGIFGPAPELRQRPGKQRRGRPLSHPPDRVRNLEHQLKIQRQLSNKLEQQNQRLRDEAGVDEVRVSRDPATGRLTHINGHPIRRDVLGRIESVSLNKFLLKGG